VPTTQKLPIRLEGIHPILAVRDISESKKFYVDLLEFEEEPWGDDTFTSIRRDNTGIYLCKGYQGNSGTWLWVGFDGDILILHDFLVKNGVEIKLPPTNFSWAFEMHVVDPDGHVLRFGTDPDPSRPFMDQQTNELF
jgi:catechol 2,3-dioxygenase-like lactoylglutathione lyase family enzyme